MNNKDKQIYVAIAGAGGRIGRQLVHASLKMDGIVIGAAFEHKASSYLGIDAGELAGINKIGVIIQNILNVKDNNFDIFIDFTHPREIMNHLLFCRKYSKAMVIGTTGFNDTEKQAIREASNDIAIVFTVNFSVGANVMLKLLEKTTKIIGNSTDIEIIEKHHNKKIDVPSGTALVIEKTIAKILNKNLKECAIRSHKKSMGKRVPGTIGLSTIRAGDILGEHTTIFFGIGERIEITHRVSNLITFANGALRAAIWLKGKKKGLFNMIDVLKMDGFKDL